jgi:AspT/YidE/YbjL antiporter-like protein
MQIDERILEFVRDFGLILFVYTIGLQVGPGFFSSLKSQGLQLNALAAGVVLLGGLIAASLRLVFQFSIPAVAGIFSGATTNTPSLAAAQAVLQNLQDQPSSNADLLGMAYAVAYPFGIVGIILTMVLIKRVFHIDAETDRIDDRPVRSSLPAGHDFSGLCRTDSCFDPSGVKAGRTPLVDVRSLLWGSVLFFGRLTKFSSADLQTGIQRENVDMSTGALPACKVCLPQDDVDGGFSLAIRDDQVDLQTRLPRILSGCFVLIKSTEILQTAGLCHD